ncbi:carboxyl transferase domain-containing protein [Bacillus sp. SL00103]
MVEGNASMYLGSPRMAEMVIGEKVTLEEMGSANMHCAKISGCGDILAKTEEEAIQIARDYLTYMPANYTENQNRQSNKAPKASEMTIQGLIPKRAKYPF